MLPALMKTVLPVILSAFLLAACGQEGKDGDRQAMREELNPPSVAYTQVVPCSLEDASCKTLVDFYERKPGFKEGLQQAMSAAGIGHPKWLEEALSTKLISKKLNDQLYVVGRACEPQNCAQILYVGFNEQNQQIFGFMRTNETMQWFGHPDELQKEWFCELDQLCQLEPKQSELKPALAQFGFPELVQLTDFYDCKEMKGGIRSKDGFLCNEQYVPKCPFSTTGCAVSARFVNDQLAMISYKYKFKGIKNEDLKKKLDQAYGKSDIQTMNTDGAAGLSGWVGEWKAGRIQVTIKRVKVTGSNRESYDDLWISFADTGLLVSNERTR